MKPNYFIGNKMKQIQLKPNQIKPHQKKQTWNVYKMVS